MGSTTGWCYIEDAVIKHTGVATFKKHKDEKPGKKFFDFQNWLIEFNGVDEVFYEIVPQVASRAAGETYHGMLAMLHTFNYSLGLRCCGIYANSWKKEFTGNGHSKKIDVCKQAIDLGWKRGEVGTDKLNDEADSIGIAYALLQKRGVKLRFEGDDD